MEHPSLIEGMILNTVIQPILIASKGNEIISI